jgi:uncharacterized membrane protein YhaH (DUF805 family)
VTFITAIRTCFSKYATFKGRATRAEFWWFYLFTVLISTIISIPGIVLLHTLWGLAVFLPVLSAAVRRLRDAGHSPYWSITVAVTLLTSTVLKGRLHRHVQATQAHPHFRGAGGGIVLILLGLGLLITTIVFLAKPSVGDGASAQEVTQHQNNATYCPACGKLRLPGQDVCAGCGSSF